MELLRKFINRAAWEKDQEYRRLAVQAAEKGFRDEVEFRCFFTTFSESERRELLRNAMLNSAKHAEEQKRPTIAKLRYERVRNADTDYEKHLATRKMPSSLVENIIFAVRRPK
jgi:hypothetical protein